MRHPHPAHMHTFEIACNQVRICSQSTHITHLACNPRVRSMMETPQGDNLGQTLHNPWVVGGWWRTGILDVKSPKKESSDEENKAKEIPLCFSYFGTRESRVVHSGTKGKMRGRERGLCLPPPSTPWLELCSAHLTLPSAPCPGSQGRSVSTHIFCFHIKLDAQSLSSLITQ